MICFDEKLEVARPSLEWVRLVVDSDSNWIPISTTETTTTDESWPINPISIVD
jgi:hypothetical protein